MFELPDYVINEQIHENNRVKVYRGYSEKDRMPVILKVVEKEYAEPGHIANLYREYEITRLFDVDGVIRPERMEQTGTVIALVSRDIGAVSLKEYIRSNKVDLKMFLETAIQIAETLNRLHNAGIVHGDLKPGNVLIDTGSKKVYIIDFSSAIPVFSKNRDTAFYNLVKTYEYMSPEQTGRLNIGVDYRSDLYSLGVMLYELLAGTTPFRAEDQDAWADAHITQTAKPPHEVQGSIPEVISDIIMKLLAKSPEERYQGANGLLYDLRECYNQLANTGEVHYFNIGSRDVSRYISLPQELIGRDDEQQFLIDALKRVSKGKTEIILVSGDPGVGKTMLIEKTLKSAVNGNGFYISGKFDQLKSSIPYAPFASAFSNLVKLLMTKSEKELNDWKRDIQQVIGRRGAVIAQVIPELEWIIGKQQPADELSPKEAENRFLMVFRDFVKVFANRKHPLVVFIDDLQWADYSSVNLLKYLSLEVDLKYVLFVGAFRDNELPEGHPVHELLAALKSGEYAGQSGFLHLKPLQFSYFADIIAESLNVKKEDISILSEVLYRKTGGNPLFLGQLLAHAYEEGLLYIQQQKWKWNIEAIDALNPGEDVLELLVKKLDRLPKKTQEILKIASCIGNRFDIHAVSKVCCKTADETISCLMPAVAERLIVPAKPLQTSMTQGPDDEYVFEFLHDRVQQAVYLPIPVQEKKEKHIAIGKIYLEHGNIEDRIMFIMDHFNRSLDLIECGEERKKLAEYNLMAGRKAKIAAAYSSALQYFRAGKSLLPDNSWTTDYKLSYDIYLELAQAEYLSANITTAEELFDTVIEKSKNELERAAVYGLKVTLYAGVGKYKEAVHTGIHSLRRLGVRIPTDPTKFDYLMELLKYKWQMFNRNIESLENLHEMRKPEQVKVADLLSRMASVTMSSHPNLYSFLILKAGNYAVKHGNTEMTCVGYLGYGITEGSVLGNYKEGEEYAKVALNLVEKFGKSSSKCIIYFVIGSLVLHWTQPAELCLKYLDKAAQAGIEAGDLLITGYSHCLLLEDQYIMGARLPDILEEVRRKREIASRIKHDNLSINVELYESTVNALMGINGCELPDAAEILNNEHLVSLVKKDQSSLATWHIRKMQLYYFLTDHRNALAESEKIQNLMGAIFGFLLQSECVFYHSLIITAMYRNFSPKERKHYRKILKNNHKQLKKWAESCRENFEDMYLLVSAEIARINNRKEQAMQLYDRAIQAAREYRHVNNEAIANELAAQYYLSEGHSRIAGAYMDDACRCYMRWGAYAKARQIKSRYPDLTGEVIVEEYSGYRKNKYTGIPKIKREDSDNTVTGSGTSSGSVDLYRLDRIIEDIYSEPDINKLLTRFIDIAIRSIGANRGYLILEKSGELYIESGKDNSSGRTLTDSIPLEEYPDISKTVVRYVARTLETVVLNCDEQLGIFAVDPYIAESNPKSIACLPVLFQGISLGVLYFENNFIAGAFAANRIERLKVLSSQVACARKFQSYLEKDYERSKGHLVEPLTEREMEVLRLISEGMSNKEIADELVITINTVKTYIKNIYEKLGVNRRVQVVARAKELNLLR